jgi:hypothetical protein
LTAAAFKAVFCGEALSTVTVAAIADRDDVAKATAAKAAAQNFLI